MKISVAMCTYNGERFLEAQLRTIAEQTTLPDELVICDDGSTDRTPEIVADFASAVSFPVHFHRNERNLGSTKNFEQAISLCKGEFIALCDQDDLWVPTKLQILLKILEQEPEVGGAFSDAALIDGNGTVQQGTLWSSFHFGPRQKRLFEKDQSFFVTQRPLVTGACFMFRSKYVESFVPIPEEFVHDGWIALVLAAVARLRAVPEKLISYRLHGSQQLGVKGLSRHEALKKGKEARVEFHHKTARMHRLAAEKLATLPATRRTITYAIEKAKYREARAKMLEGSRLLRIFQGLALFPGHLRFAWGPVSYIRDFLHD